MTSAPITQIIPPPAMSVEEPHPPLRLRLKPKGPTTGYVDGAWWPWSPDLTAELPALLAVLAVRLGSIERVSYHLPDWSPTVRRLCLTGSVVRLGGYRFQHAHTVDVLGALLRLTLLVVPPEASPDAAHRALMAAGHRGNVDSIEELLTPHAPDPEALGIAESEAETALQGWELDGGRMHEGV
jgi:Family of unknown function (DUF5994)